MEDLFARIVLGHLVGDYLLQNKYMAIHKTDKTEEGANICLLHCAIYTATVCMFLCRFDSCFNLVWAPSPLVVALVFLSHWPIDRTALAYFWLKFIKGRDILYEFKSTVTENEYREIGLPFACFVYAVADNTMHLVLMWTFLRLVI
ncbi:MAG: DUF3307 domain-containing protein [Candidatus Vogelbacteria bacterium]|nr:DUF3307 domain-containing protein [Candidatus Vogelbacteria bacterium]